MRQFKILKTCRDKHTGRTLTAGTIIEVSEARAKELEAVPAYAAEIKAEKPAPDPVKEESPAEPKEPKKAPAKKKTAGRKKKEA